MSLKGVTAPAGPNSSSHEIRISGFTSATIVGSYKAPCRRPPVTRRAPLATASLTHSSTRIASFSRIIGPTWTAGSSWLPTFSAATFGRRASRKSPYTFPAVSTRWVEMHTCPALAYPVAATAAATLSSSASGITMTGEFEPSSIVTRLMPAVLQMRSPTSRLPVKVIFLTRRSATSRSPISPPEPVSVLSPSGGSPASSRISVSRSADSGVSVAGLSTTAFPPARAGPTLWQTRVSGKLNGLVPTPTPHGPRIVTPNLPRPSAAPSTAAVSPRNRLASPAVTPLHPSLVCFGGGGAPAPPPPPPPPRNLTLTRAYPLPLRAGTQPRHARPPPQSHARAFWRPSPPLSRAPEPGIQDVAEGVAEQVRAEHGEADRDPGAEHQVGRLLRVLRGRDGEHAPPRRVRLRHPEPEERH